MFYYQTRKFKSISGAYIILLIYKLYAIPMQFLGKSKKIALGRVHLGQILIVFWATPYKISFLEYEMVDFLNAFWIFFLVFLASRGNLIKVFSRTVRCNYFEENNEGAEDIEDTEDTEDTEEDEKDEKDEEDEKDEKDEKDEEDEEDQEDQEDEEDDKDDDDEEDDDEEDDDEE